MPDLTIAAAVPLAAELLEPADGPARAIAILIPGSGPIDRNGDARQLPLGIQRQLAEGLAARGIASIRWDKRGVGASGGDFLTTGFGDLVADALAVVDHVATGPTTATADNDRPLPIIAIGHSEGSALVARVLVERPALAGGVVISPYARSGLEVLRWQSAALQQHVPKLVTGILRLMRTDFETQTEKNRAKLLATTGDVARVGGARINARWHREFMAYDPSDDLRASRQPVLAIGGAFDLQSPPEDTLRIGTLRTGPTRVEVLDGLSHILRRQPAPSLKDYRADVRRPLDERIVPLITAWVTDLLAEPAS